MAPKKIAEKNDAKNKRQRSSADEESDDQQPMIIAKPKPPPSGGAGKIPAKPPPAKEGDESLKDSSSEDEGLQPMTIAKPKAPPSGGAGKSPTAITVEVPDGKILAKPVGTKPCKLTGTIMGACIKKTDKGPSSVKATIAISNIDPGHKEVIRAGQITGLVLAKDEKVKKEDGSLVYATLMDGSVDPTMKVGGGALQFTLQNLKGDKGVRETTVKELVPGATIELTDPKFGQVDHGSVYLKAESFKVTEKVSSEAPRSGVEKAMATARCSGGMLLVTGGFHCEAFCSTNAPTEKMNADFAKVKAALATSKDAFVKEASFLPKYEAPTDPLHLLGGDSPQMPPVLCFYKTKLPNGGGGVLVNDATLAIYLHKQGPTDELIKAFHGTPVATTVVKAWAIQDSKFMGLIVTLDTELQFVPDPAAPPKKSQYTLTVDGPSIGVPLSYLAAPFGVNDRGTLDLLMEGGVISSAHMLVMPDGIKADNKYGFALKYPCQITIDARNTLRTVALSLSPKCVQTMYGDAKMSTPAVGIGESLVDLIPIDPTKNETDKKPIVATHEDQGGVASLRTTPVELGDKTLEYYGVVKNMLDVTQAAGNFECGTDSDVGTAAFLDVFGGKYALALDAVKKGTAAIFAVRVAPKTATVAAGSAAGSSAGSA